MTKPDATSPLAYTLNQLILSIHAQAKANHLQVGPDGFIKDYLLETPTEGIKESEWAPPSRLRLSDDGLVKAALHYVNSKPFMPLEDYMRNLTAYIVNRHPFVKSRREASSLITRVTRNNIESHWENLRNASE